MKRLASLTFLFALLASPAMAVNRVTIYNGCHYKVTFMVGHAATYRNWQPLGWWTLSSGKELKLKNPDGTDLIHLIDHSLYIFAYPTDDPDNTKKYWQDTNRTPTIYQGKSYHLMYAGGVKSNGDLTINLVCDKD